MESQFQIVNTEEVVVIDNEVLEEAIRVLRKNLDRLKKENEQNNTELKIGV